MPPLTTSSLAANRSKSTVASASGSGKLTSLKREWSSNALSKPSTSAQPTEDDPTPPFKRTKSGSASASGGWRANGGTRDSGVGLPGGPAPPGSSFQAASSALSGKSAFTTRAPIQSKSTNFRNSTSSTGESSKLKAASTAKREFPWDNMSVSASTSKVVAGRKGAFHNLAGVGKVKNVAGTSSAITKHAGMSIAALVTLSPEQRSVLNHVLSGASVFFTGSAGTGKSVLLRQIIRDLRTKWVTRPDAVAVTASTGMAACNVGGTTIHSFSGIGLGVEKADALVTKVKKNRKAASRWKRTKVLVVDEVSMVDGELFDKLEYIARKLTGVEKPFGGIQIVVTGDFFQLPPVTKGKVTFAFDAKTWDNVMQHKINLTQVFRQKDTTFIDMLNEMRMGCLTPSSIEKFKSLRREPVYKDGIDPTELYPIREEVARSNQARLNALPGPPTTYTAIDGGKAMLEQRKRDYANMMAVEKLVLKVDAQVMMIKNSAQDENTPWLVNGLVGKVVDFVSEKMNVEEWMEKNAMGLAGGSGSGGGGNDDLEWDDADVKPSKGPGKQGGGAGAGAGAGMSGAGTVPIVKWFCSDGQQRFTAVTRAEFKVENAENEVQSSRKQFPLILAWAMSIHKSQGQTLARVKVNLGRVFEKGQSYVALSRATSLEGLQVLNFDEKKVMAHPAVIRWSQEHLTSAQ